MTLAEVLMAIFIMSIGLIALLTLFPLGAASMAQAIKDDRTGHIAGNAKAIANIQDIRHNGAYWPAAFQTGDPRFNLPNRTNSGGAGYPVYVDPIGFQAYGNSAGFGQPVGQIARVSPSFLTGGNAEILSWFSFTDDITFDANGEPPGPAAAGNVTREGRYSFAYLLRMPSATNTSVVDMSVVVYAGRPTQLGSNMQPAGENAFSAYFPSSNVISLVYNDINSKPLINRGGWVLDATMTPEPHGYFYRVVNVTDPGQNGPNSVDLEVQPDLRGGYGQNVQGTVVVLDGVTEVFEAGTGT